MTLLLLLQSNLDLTTIAVIAQNLFTHLLDCVSCIAAHENDYSFSEQVLQMILPPTYVGISSKEARRWNDRWRQANVLAGYHGDLCRWTWGIELDRIRYQPFATYWKQVAELDTGEDTKNANILAARIIARGGPVTHNDVNSVLAEQGYSVTAEEFNTLIALPMKTYGVTQSGVVTEEFMTRYPNKVSKGHGRWGVYRYTNNITGVDYYGMSTVLHERLRHYWSKFAHMTKLRPILADIRKYGLENFTLQVCELPNHLCELRLLLALEQYYILVHNPANNSIKVAGGSPGGMAVAQSNRERLGSKTYVYCDNVLVHMFASRRSLKSQLGLGHSTVAKAFEEGHLFNKFVISHVAPSKDAAQDIWTVTELIAAVDLARTESLKTRKSNPHTATPSVTLTNVETGVSHTFASFALADRFSQEHLGKYLNHLTIRRRIKSGIPLNGYLITSP